MTGLKIEVSLKNRRVLNHGDHCIHNQIQPLSDSTHSYKTVTQSVAIGQVMTLGQTQYACADTQKCALSPVSTAWRHGRQPARYQLRSIPATVTLYLLPNMSPDSAANDSSSRRSGRRRKRRGEAGAGLLAMIISFLCDAVVSCRRTDASIALIQTHTVYAGNFLPTNALLNDSTLCGRQIFLARHCCLFLCVKSVTDA